jgi:predicted AAA+ superfamily ATPase
MGWVSPKTITGDAAREEKYLRRDHINEYFWREVEKGNHILFVAPRRVGKTSVMVDLAENPPEGYACIYQNIEGVKSRNFGGY